MILISEVLMHPGFERVNIGRFFDMEILGLQGSEEALDDRIVQTIALAAHALLDAVTGEHGLIRLHFVIPTLI